MKYLFALIFSGLGICINAQPHADLIKKLNNQSTIPVAYFSRYQIKINKFQIDGKDYDYGSLNILSGLTRINKFHPAAVFLVEADNSQFALHSKRGIFIRPTNTYKFIINVDPNVHNVIFEGSIMIVSESDHLNRNKYNKVAKGVLKKSPDSDYYVDECGKHWRKISQVKNLTHNISKNIKFLKLAEGGGEYETIREKLQGESWSSDEFHGPNVTTGKYRGTYNFGITSNILAHTHFDLEPHLPIVWGGNYNNSPEQFLCGNKANNTTLFLIDRSGSMASKGTSGKPKIEEAKLAATNSIRSFNNQDNALQEVGVLSFSGGCSNTPTASQKLVFNTNMQQAQQRINAIRAPGGGTPLREAVDEVTSRLRNYVISNGSNTPPKLIVLSDGIASCQKIRPAGVYATGNFNSSNETSYSNFNTNKSLQSEIPVIVKYYTIGFAIKAGSEAERDLQYLAESSGGKYLNAQNEYELTRAFQKFYRVYTPKEIPAQENLDSQSAALFKKGVLQIKAENYESGLSSFKTFHISTQKDFNAVFNLALMYDANNYHLAAIKMYEKYLVLHINAPDKDWVLKQIDYLKKDREIYLNYILQVLKSDLSYLELHFKKIQNGESLALAEEFKGFIKEKGNFYKVLPSQLQLAKKQLEINCKEISRALRKCSKLIKQDSKNWDKNASPILSMTYLNLERLIENF
ncbi:vWA domain-containing protein [Ascidiimonas sp. W6]|uniref:vWA domain-containing protein n=1 Tax=Ascidiimonas meishanensis TaxID=3128903 RepID=UPI0030EF6098